MISTALRIITQLVFLRPLPALRHQPSNFHQHLNGHVCRSCVLHRFLNQHSNFPLRIRHNGYKLLFDRNGCTLAEKGFSLVVKKAIKMYRHRLLLESASFPTLLFRHNRDTFLIRMKQRNCSSKRFFASCQ